MLYPIQPPAGMALSGKVPADHSSFQALAPSAKMSFREQLGKLEAVSRLSNTVLWAGQILVQILDDKCRTLTNYMGPHCTYIWGISGVCTVVQVLQSKFHLAAGH